MVKLWIKYDVNASELGPLNEFVVDLNEACDEALAVLHYELEAGNVPLLFEGITHDPQQPEAAQKVAMCKVLKDRIGPLYKAIVMAIDPNDPTNVKSSDWKELRKVIRSGFINAQRGLDDIHKDRDVLAKVLEDLLNTAMGETATLRIKTLRQNSKLPSKLFKMVLKEDLIPSLKI